MVAAASTGMAEVVGIFCFSDFELFLAVRRSFLND